jgi:REP element-mobilizing transposase RayT
MNRGDRGEDIFRDDFDRESFLQALADTCAKTAWQVHAFCLMPNHFHLVVETPQPSLVAGMKWFLGTYTARFNHRHKLTGHVFAGRYKSLLVGGEGGYLRTVCDYVHLNPVRARLLSSEAALRSFRWSSFSSYLLPPNRRPDWLRVDRLFGECGIQVDSAESRQEFERRLETRRHQELDEEFQPIKGGWCFGDEQFRHDLLAQVDGGAGQYHYGTEVQEAAEAKAARIIDEELRRAVWTEADLALRRKGDPAKLRIAGRLRSETTVTLQWITARLRMGTRSHLSHLLYWQRRAELGQTTVDDAKRAAESHGRKSRKVEAGQNPSAQSTDSTDGFATVERARNRNLRVLQKQVPPSVSKQKDQAIPLTDPYAFDPASD